VTPFFILALPRSRTAWLANFMTYGGHFCYHEGMNGCHTVAQYKEKIAGKGDSSTSAILVQDHFPQSRRLIVLSHPKKAIEYSLRNYGPANYDVFYQIRDLLGASDGLKVEIDEIDSRIQEIWEYLVDTPFNKERSDMLTTLNIQMKTPYGFDIEAMKSIMKNIGEI